MSVLSWSTRAPIEPAFERAWLECLTRSPRANFALHPGYLSWEAEHGRHSVALLAEAGGRTGAMVLREEGRTLASGWPWRPQVAIEGLGPLDRPDEEGAALAALFRAAEGLARGRSLRVHLPAPPRNGVAHYPSGATLLQSLEVSDAELFQAMAPSKRRLVRRARAEGCEIRVARDHGSFREFATVQRQADQRRGRAPSQDPGGTPGAGEGWREWELPWMGLVVATLAGRVECGVGDGIFPGGVLEGRCLATTPAGRRLGASVLVCYEAARRARDLGHRWLNHGGDTPFKRDLAGPLGRRIQMYCWMGGSRATTLARHGEAFARRLRPRAIALARTVLPLIGLAARRHWKVG